MALVDEDPWELIELLHLGRSETKQKHHGKAPWKHKPNKDLTKDEKTASTYDRVIDKSLPDYDTQVRRLRTGVKDGKERSRG